MLEWINFINRAYMNLAAPTVKIFKLDKQKTIIDDLYQEESSSRIYLPPFDTRAFHLDNRFTQILGPLPYQETEENILFFLNFESMVQKLRSLKKSNMSEIDISYSGNSTPYATNLNNILTIGIDDSVLQTFDLTNSSYNTTSKLAGSINVLDNFSVVLYIKNDLSTNLVSFNKTTFKGSTLKIYSPDNTYDNCTDVIEQGDLILTNKWRLYEVYNSMPSGDMGWDYVTWMLSCNLGRLDRYELPNDYNEQIKNNQYGITDIRDIET